MTNLIFLKKYVCFFVIAFALLASCNNGETGKIMLNKSGMNSGNGTVMSPLVPVGISDSLYYLWISSDSLKKVDTTKKVILAFKLGNGGILTLDGWNSADTSGNNFPPSSIWHLTPTNFSSIKVGSLTLFANLIIHRKKLKKIVDEIDRVQAQYVYFVPKLSGTNISYEIIVNRIAPTLDTLNKMVPLPVIATANPSPPHRYDQ